jgi:hypothetical protein
LTTSWDVLHPSFPLFTKKICLQSSPTTMSQSLLRVSCSHPPLQKLKQVAIQGIHVTSCLGPDTFRRVQSTTSASGIKTTDHPLHVLKEIDLPAASLHSRNRSWGMAQTVMALPICSRSVSLSLERFQDHLGLVLVPSAVPRPIRHCSVSTKKNLIVQSLIQLSFFMSHIVSVCDLRISRSRQALFPLLF